MILSDFYLDKKHDDSSIHGIKPMLFNMQNIL